MKTAKPQSFTSAAWSSCWLSFWLAVALIVCKGVLLGLPSGWSAADLVGFGRDLAIMSHADVLFAILVGAIGSLAMRCSERWPGRRRAIHVAVVSACVASLVYGIASVQVFAYLRSHLTYPLIYLAGDMKNMRSSLGAFVTPKLLTALVAGPVLYLLFTWASPRVAPTVGKRYRQVGLGIGLCAILVFVAYGHHGYSSLPWADRVDRRVAENPHWVLVRSLLTDLTSDGNRVQLAVEFPPEHLGEFAIASERRAAEVVNSTSEISDRKSQNDEPNSQISDLRIARPTRPMNVIVYVLESVGTQHLGLYGSPYATTPQLEKEAANSMVFDNFYAHCGVTANSLVAINLGIYPGLTWREYTVEQPDLPGTTLAELLHARAYRTAYMTSGEIQYVNMDGFLRGRGYDLICGYERLGCRELIMSWGVEDRCLVDGVLGWIDRDREQPFFAMVWTQQTHHPYEPSPAVPFIDFFKGLPKDQLPPDDYDLGRYLNTLREADRQLGRLFDGLRRLGVADDTLVVVTGDHGEGFGSPHDIYGHGGKVFDEIVKVPLVLWNPRIFNEMPAESRRVKTVGGHIDLNSTLAEILDLPPAGSWQGRSLFDLGRPPRVYFYAANDDYLLGVREQDQKYIYNATIGREQLFDLAADPHEQINRALEETERCRELRSRVAAWVKYEEGHIARLRQQTPMRRAIAAGVAHGAEQ